MADPDKRPIIIIKKKAAHGGHHGGAWKVAYADFVTAMMALFIVLWLLSSNQKVKQAVSGYFRDPTGKGKQVGTTINGTGRDVSALKDDMSELKEKLKSVIKLIPHFDQLKGNIEFTITQEGLKIELLENSKGMFFESGKPQPSPMGKEILVTLAKELGRIPNKILIEGHTDATPFGGGGETYSNWELSSDRANEARRLMEGSGLVADQVAEIRGFADQDLRNKKNPQDPSNRRVSLLVKYLENGKQLKLDASGTAMTTTSEHPEQNPGGPVASLAASHGTPSHDEKK
jgi:chemotaxis protein MotB